MGFLFLITSAHLKAVKKPFKLTKVLYNQLMKA